MGDDIEKLAGFRGQSLTAAASISTDFKRVINFSKLTLQLV